MPASQVLVLKVFATTPGFFFLNNHIVFAVLGEKNKLFELL